MTRSEWTREDRALMQARRMHKATLCPGCQVPKEKAWHPDMDGWYQVSRTNTCHVCTAHRWPDGVPDGGVPVTFTEVTDERDYQRHPLPDFPSTTPSPSRRHR